MRNVLELLVTKTFCGRITQEVSLEVAEYFSSLEVGIDSETDARVLRAEVVFPKATGRRCVVGNAAKTSADSTTDVSGTPIPGEIDKAQRT